MDTMVELRNINKTFFGNKVLTEATLTVRQGSIHALVGANGAGKSTLLKVLSGALPPDSGTITVRGHSFPHLSPSLANRLGIAMVYQETSLIPTLNVVQNVFLGIELHRFGLLKWSHMRQGAREILQKVGLRVPLAALVRDLSFAQRQLLEIAKALVRNAQIIVLDEPTTSLSPMETNTLFLLLKQLSRENRTFIYVSHRLYEITSLCDSATVLRDGETVQSYESLEGVTETTLVKGMIGRAFDYSIRPAIKERSQQETPVLVIDQLTKRHRFYDICFKVYRGEVLGLFGLVGSGRSDVLNAIMGRVPADVGSIIIQGRQFAARQLTPRRSINAGIAYIPEDRRTQGLVMQMPILNNETLSSPPSRFGVISRLKRSQAAIRATEALGIHQPITRKVSFLSGGNQQKVMFARWTQRPFNVFLFDEPTRGIDVETKSEIYRYIDQLADSGAAVVVVSSELVEIMRLSHRILVMHEGRIAGEVSGQTATQELLMSLSSGIGTSDSMPQ